jgi:hypothetical protein
VVTLTDIEISVTLRCLTSSLTIPTGCYISSVGACLGVSYMFCNHMTISPVCSEEDAPDVVCELCTVGDAVWERT